MSASPGVCAWDEVPAEAQLHDFGDYVLLPGLVDTHVHINEPGRTEWEGFTTATRAAAAGGVTTLVDMPLNCRPEIDQCSGPGKASAAPRRQGRGSTGPPGAAWCAATSNHWRLWPAAGVAGFKCFLVHSGIEGFAWVDKAHLTTALTSLRGSGLPLLAHAEVCGPIDSATEALNRNRRGLAQLLYLSCLATRRGRGRGDRSCSSAWQKNSDADPHRAPVQRAGFAAAGRGTSARRTRHRGNLPSLPLVCRRGHS